MLQFAVVEKEPSARRWSLANAHLLGPDDLVIPGDIEQEGDRIVCRPPGHAAAALALQYDAGEAGVLLLQTCLLPPRETPYVLALELARHRIKTFLVKSEEWQMFDLDVDGPAMSAWDEARRLFTRAVNTRDPIEADRLSRESLARAIHATDLLQRTHAEILLHRRFGTKAASSTTLGVHVNPRRAPSPFGSLLEREFDLISLPTRWSDLQPEEGVYRWEALDRWMAWARKAAKPVVAGPLLDFSREGVPEWVDVWRNDYDTVRDLVYDHLERVVHRYRNVVSLWNIGGGVNTNEHLRFEPNQMLDLTRMANLLVKQSPRRTRTMLEIVQPFGSHVAEHPDSVAPMVFIDRVVQEGIRVDCFGVQVVFGEATSGRSARDLMQVSNLLDRFFLLEMPVLLTRVGVPSEPGSAAAGRCGGGWSAEAQAEWAAQVFRLALSKPYIDSVFWSDLYDEPTEKRPPYGLIDRSGRPKPVLKALLEFRRRLRKPLGQLKSTYASSA